MKFMLGQQNEYFVTEPLPIAQCSRWNYRLVKFNLEKKNYKTKSSGCPSVYALCSIKKIIPRLVATQ